MVILDTNLLSLLEWVNSPASLTLQARLDRLPADQIATTVVTYEEKTRGWLAILSGAKKVTEQVEAYRRLKRHVQLFCTFTILDFDEAAAVEFQRLRKQFRRAGTMDLKIAAIALAGNATLLTRNLKDFQPIPGLKVEDWTQL